MLTVGQINEKISLLRSKIAVTQGTVLFLKTHYMPPEGGTAEMHFTRSDYGKVPPNHVEATIADLVNYLDTLKHELKEWENTPVSPPQPAQIEPSAQPAVETKSKTNGTVPPAQKTAPRKETSSGTQRTGSDQPSTQQPATGAKAG